MREKYHYERGDLVYIWFDTGAFGATQLHGVVTKAGPKSYTVRWMSDICNRFEQGRQIVEPVRAEMMEIARQDLGLDWRRAKHKTRPADVYELRRRLDDDWDVREVLKGGTYVDRGPATKSYVRAEFVFEERKRSE